MLLLLLWGLCRLVALLLNCWRYILVDCYACRANNLIDVSIHKVAVVYTCYDTMFCLLWGLYRLHRLMTLGVERIAYLWLVILNAEVVVYAVGDGANSI